MLPGVLEDIGRRALPDTVLVSTDRAPGLIQALEELFSASLRQRCLAHKIRNIVMKVPPDAIPEVLKAARAAY